MDERPELVESEGVPLPLPNEVQGPGRARSAADLFTGGASGSPMSFEGLALARVLLVLLAYAAWYRWRMPWLAGAVVVALVALSDPLRSWLVKSWEAWQGRRLERVRERARQETLRRRTSHIPTAALSRRRDEPDPAKGVSPPPED